MGSFLGTVVTLIVVFFVISVVVGVVRDSTHESRREARMKRTREAAMRTCRHCGWRGNIYLTSKESHYIGQKRGTRYVGGMKVWDEGVLVEDILGGHKRVGAGWREIGGWTEHGTVHTFEMRALCPDCGSILETMETEKFESDPPS